MEPSTCGGRRRGGGMLAENTPKGWEGVSALRNLGLVLELLCPVRKALLFCSSYFCPPSNQQSFSK